MILLLILFILGFLDSLYLTFKHYQSTLSSCQTPSIPFMSIFNDCAKILISFYSEIFGIPLALIGVIHYLFLTILIFLITKKSLVILKYLLIIESIIDFLASLYFMYLQIFILQSLCFYCTLSVIISTLILLRVNQLFKEEKFEIHLLVYQFFYKYLLKPILFLFDSEFIHEKIISLGKITNKTPLTFFIKTKFKYEDKTLNKKIDNIFFKNPVGLAAGFDYNTNLINLLPNLDFGFHTIGTFTNLPYQGNPKSRLSYLLNQKP